MRSNKMLGCWREGPIPPHPFRSECDICEDGRCVDHRRHTQAFRRRRNLQVTTMNMYSYLMTVTFQELILGRRKLSYSQSASAKHLQDLAVVDGRFPRVVNAKRMVWGGIVFVLPLVRCPPAYHRASKVLVACQAGSQVISFVDNGHGHANQCQIVRHGQGRVRIRGRFPQ